MEQKISKTSKKKLAAYSSAAGIGAFAVASSAQAVVVVNSGIVTGDGGLNDILTGGQEFQIDFDGDGTVDTTIVNNVGAQSIQAFGPGELLAKDQHFSNPIPGAGVNSYYVEGFAIGDVLDSNLFDYFQDGTEDLGSFATNEPGVPDGTNDKRDNRFLARSIPVSTYVVEFNYFDDSQSFLGYSFDIGSDVHFGWVNLGIVDTTIDTAGGLTMQLLGYGYENVSDASLTIGVIPETSTYAVGLGLLALGAAGLRKRRQKEI